MKKDDAMTLDELRQEYGLSESAVKEMKASCTLTLRCSSHTVSCTSQTGNCDTITKDLVNASGEVYDKITVEIICDGQHYKC